MSLQPENVQTGMESVTDTNEAATAVVKAEKEPEKAAGEEITSLLVPPVSEAQTVQIVNVPKVET